MSTAVDLLLKEKTALLQELEGLQERAKEIRASVRSIEDALALLQGNSIPSLGGTKSLKELVIRELHGQDEGLMPGEIAQILSEAGRSTSSQSVSSTLSRLKGEGKVDPHPTRHGVWVIKKKTPPPLFGGGEKNEGLRDGSRDRLATESPEGSIPSSSTSRRPPWEDDDETPF